MKSNHHPVPLAGRLFYYSMTFISLFIGGLQMYRLHAGVLTNYGADFFGTAWFYTMWRQRKSWLLGDNKGTLAQRLSEPGISAILIFIACAASEFGQRFGLVPGVFDWWDMSTFAAAVSASYLIDRRFHAFPAPALDGARSAS